jgi:transmembrane sensor
MSSRRVAVDERAAPSLEEQAADTFVQRTHGDWNAADQAALKGRLTQDPAYAEAYRRVEASWASLESYAEVPEVMAYRQEAIAYARKSSAARWLRASRENAGWRRVAAVVAGITLIAMAAWHLWPYGYRPGEYRTGIGEQRLVELADHSRIALDAATRLRVHYTHDGRTVELLGGQAQFSVAKDPTRPFKVVAGDRAIVAVGTVFTVEYVDQRVHVAMMEGKVAVVAAPVNSPSITGPTSVERSREPRSIELSAGEELRVSREGDATVDPHADIEAATAWREGKVIIRTETLGAAVARMNRYSTLQIRIEDPALTTKQISGVFEAGDTQGFLSAVQRYMPLMITYADAETVELKLR